MNRMRSHHWRYPTQLPSRGELGHGLCKWELAGLGLLLITA